MTMLHLYEFFLKKILHVDNFFVLLFKKDGI